MEEILICKLAPMGSDDAGQMVGFGFIDDKDETYRFIVSTPKFARIIHMLEETYVNAVAKQPERGERDPVLVNPMVVKGATVGVEPENETSIITLLLDSGRQLTVSMSLKMSEDVCRGLLQSNEALRNQVQSLN